MITNGTTNWHYLAIKNISGILRGITSNHDGDLLFKLLLFMHNKKKT